MVTNETSAASHNTHYLVDTQNKVDSVMDQIGLLLLHPDVPDEKIQKVTTVESCTSGLLSSCLTDIHHSSRYLKVATTTYANEAKEEFLGVRAETLALFTELSPETAKEMADGGLKLAGADICVSTTGIAGEPVLNEHREPVWHVWVGISTKFGTYSRFLEVLAVPPFGRDCKRKVKLAFCLFALEQLLELLQAEKLVNDYLCGVTHELVPAYSNLQY